MREERVIAIAGTIQAASLVRSLSTRGDAEPGALRVSLASVFKIDADNAADVFGGIANLRLGFEALVSQVETSNRDPVLTRMMLTSMRLERALMRRPEVLGALRDGIQAIAREPQFEPDSTDSIQRLARLYTKTLSTLRPRILVEGNPRFISDAANVDRIRALLLAAVRATVLWRQLGGNQLRLFFRHRQYAMMARGLLAQCTLSGS
jgi:high frequency lysogenization protein